MPSGATHPRGAGPLERLDRRSDGSDPEGELMRRLMSVMSGRSRSPASWRGGRGGEQGQGRGVPARSQGAHRGGGRRPRRGRQPRPGDAESARHRGAAEPDGQAPARRSARAQRGRRRSVGGAAPDGRTELADLPGRTGLRRRLRRRAHPSAHGAGRPLARRRPPRGQPALHHGPGHRRAGHPEHRRRSQAGGAGRRGRRSTSSGARSWRGSTPTWRAGRRRWSRRAGRRSSPITRASTTF